MRLPLVGGSQLMDRVTLPPLLVRPQVLPFLLFHSTNRVVLQLLKNCWLNILNCVVTPPPFQIYNLSISSSLPRLSLWELLLVFLPLLFLHLPYAVCLTVWLALFALSNYKVTGLGCSLLASAFKLLKFWSSKCCHCLYVCLLLDFTLLEDYQFSRKSVGEGIIKFSVRDKYSSQEREMRNSDFQTFKSMCTAPGYIIFFSSYKPLISKRIVWGN